MIIFIDESGTHKQLGHSTIAVVYVEVANLAVFEKNIKAIEHTLQISSFHWTEERWYMKNKFLTRIFELDFIVKAAVFQNSSRPEKMLEIVFQQFVTEKKIETVFIDGKKPKWYEQKFKKVLRDKGISIKKLKTVRRETEPGIQLADALAGLIRYHYDNPEAVDAKKWVLKLKRAKKLYIKKTPLKRGQLVS